MGLLEDASITSNSHSFVYLNSKITQAKIFHAFELVQKYGTQIGMPHVKRLKKDLYELRIKGTQECRLIFTISKNRIIFLHGFLKKSNKTPSRDLDLAQKRLTLI